MTSRPMQYFPSYPMLRIHAKGCSTTARTDAIILLSRLSSCPVPHKRWALTMGAGARVRYRARNATPSTSP